MRWGLSRSVRKGDSMLSIEPLLSSCLDVIFYVILDLDLFISSMLHMVKHAESAVRDSDRDRISSPDHFHCRIRRY